MRPAGHRPSAAQRGYDARWRRTRASYLQRNPLCERCRGRGVLTAATQVHHRVELVNGGTNDDANLEALCHACHSRHTADTRPWGKRQPSGPRGCAADGTPIDPKHPWHSGR